MIDAIHSFLAVVAFGNFSKAANAQDLAVSSVSRKIDGLELELGAKLFNRNTRVLVLTDAGEKFLPVARHLLGEIAEVKDAISSLQAEPRGIISVTAPTSFGRRHVAPAIAGFLKKYPLLEIELQIGDDIVDLVSERVDVAVRIGVLPDSDLLATRLADQRRVACASPAYIKRHGAPAHPEALLQHNCLTVRSTPARVGWWQFAGVNGNKPLAVRGSFRSDDSDALLHGALNGLGVAHLATWLVSDDIRQGRLVPLFVGEALGPTVTSSAIHAVRMPGRAAAKAKLFVDYLSTVLVGEGEALPYWDRAFLPGKKAV